MMTFSIGEGLLVLFGLVPAALLTVWIVLRLFDWGLKKGSFGRDYLPTLQGNPMAMAVYLGARFIGVCILVAELYSRFI